MGTTVVSQLTPAQIANTQAAITSMEGLGSGTPRSTFTFFASFDGTNNDRANVALSGNPYQTNVANVYEQVQTAHQTNNNIDPHYYPGVGTGGENGNIINAGIAPTSIIHATAEKALADFTTAARDYLRDNPTATTADLSASAAGFSRGSATAVVFAQMLNERGLVLPDGTVVAPPGSIAVNALALMDPVGTFIDGDLRIPPNVHGQVLVTQALDETRSDFRPLNYSDDPRVVTIPINGNHCGIGGGQELQGTGVSPEINS